MALSLSTLCSLLERLAITAASAESAADCLTNYRERAACKHTKIVLARLFLLISKLFSHLAEIAALGALDRFFHFFFHYLYAIVNFNRQLFSFSASSSFSSRPGAALEISTQTSHQLLNSFLNSSSFLIFHLSFI